MDWREVKADWGVAFEGSADDLDDTDAVRSAVEIWTLLSQRAFGGKPHRWDVVRLELWPDSGRSIIFPANEPFTERTDDVVIDVVWPSLQRAWDDASRAYDLDEDEGPFEEAINRAVAALLQVMERGLRIANPSNVRFAKCYTWGENYLRDVSIAPQ